MALAWDKSQAGEQQEAAKLYQRAVQLNDPESGPVAAGNLARLQWLSGDRSAAVATARRAMSMGNPTVAAKAAVLLGTVLRELGDPDGARTAFREAISSGHPRHAGLGLCFLAQLEIDAGNEAIAEQLLAEAQGYPGIGHHDSDLILGELAVRSGDPEAAQRLYEEALESDDRGLRAEAALHLGHLLTWRGDQDGAAAAFRRSAGENVDSVSELARERLRHPLQPESARLWFDEPREGYLPLGLDKTAENVDEA